MKFVGTLSAIPDLKSKPKKILGMVSGMTNSNPEIENQNQTVQNQKEVNQLEKQSKSERPGPDRKRIVGSVSVIKQKEHKCDDNTNIIDSGAKPVAFKNKNLLTDIKPSHTVSSLENTELAN